MNVVDKLRGITTLPPWAQCPISPAEARELLSLIERARQVATDREEDR